MNFSAEDRTEVIRELREQGLTPPAIAEELEISTSLVNKTLNDLIKKGQYIRQSLETRLLFSDVIEDYIRQGDDEMTIDEICVKYDITRNSLYYILREKGVELRKDYIEEKEGRKAALDAAIKMYQDGAKLNYIEHQTGVHQMTLSRELTKRNIPTRKALAEKARAEKLKTLENKSKEDKEESNG